MKPSLTSKIVAPIAVAICIGALAAGSAVWQQVREGTTQTHKVASDALRQAHAATQEQIQTALREKAAVVGSLLAKTSVDFLVSYDFVLLNELKQNAEHDADIAYVGFLKPDGSAFIPYEAKAGIEEILVDIVSDGRKVGAVAVGIDPTRVTKVIAASTESSYAAQKALQRSSETSVRRILGSVMGVQALTGLCLCAIAVLVIRRGAVAPLRGVVTVMKQLASGAGDLRVRMPGEAATDEIGELARAMNGFMTHLQRMVAEIREATDGVSSQSRLVKAEGEAIRDATAEQATRSSQVAASIHEMKMTLSEVTSNTQDAALSANRGMERVTEGRSVTDVAATRALRAEHESAATVAQLQILGEATQKIAGIITVINDITKQTSLLSLNASIEAARAGERGRGFALVADEVRALALRTRRSTGEIEAMISSLQENAAEAIERAKHCVTEAQANAADAQLASGTLAEIAEEVEKMVSRNEQVAASTEQQTAAASEIENNVTMMDRMAERSRVSADRALATATGLESSAERLRALVGKFDI